MTDEKILVFDMDGTIADLYGVENWLEDLRAENPRPYEMAKPLYDMDILNPLLEVFKLQGWKIIITTWLAKGASKDYDRLVREYQNVFYKLVEARDSLSSAFSASYPEQAEEIERAANEEFGNVTKTTRFQKELLKWQQKVLSAQ